MRHTHTETASAASTAGPAKRPVRPSVQSGVKRRNDAFVNRAQGPGEQVHREADASHPDVTEQDGGAQVDVEAVQRDGDQLWGQLRQDRREDLLARAVVKFFDGVGADLGHHADRRMIVGTTSGSERASTVRNWAADGPATEERVGAAAASDSGMGRSADSTVARKTVASVSPTKTAVSPRGGKSSGNIRPMKSAALPSDPTIAVGLMPQGDHGPDYADQQRGEALQRRGSHPARISHQRPQRPDHMFSSTLIGPARLKDWKIMPIPLRRTCSRGPVGPLRWRSRVDLPAPKSLVT